MSIRPIKQIVQAKPTIEGAGVKLRRAFGFGDTSDFDPFLLFDDFRNDNPDDYMAGFPWHPHRGIETVTYVLAGAVSHGDSLGNSGTLSAGDVQWMTAGRGILHQEMPQGDENGRMHGFQLWANLPSSQKMTAPRYQDVTSGDIPEVVDDDGTRVRVICGNFWGKTGPVDGIAADPRYLDVRVPAGLLKTLPVETSLHAFAYVFQGSGTFRDASQPRPGGIGRCRCSRAGGRSVFSAIRQGRRGDRPGRGGWRQIPVGVGAATARAGRLARPHRDEHRTAVAASLRGATRGHVHRVALTCGGRGRLVDCRRTCPFPTPTASDRPRRGGGRSRSWLRCYGRLTLTGNGGRCGGPCGLASSCLRISSIARSSCGS